jgi:hypothetical protein
MTRHHAVHAGDSTHILNNISHMTPEETEQIYGIEFREGQAIYDPIYNKTFNSLSEWVAYTIKQEELEYEEDINTFKSDHPGYS